MEIGSLLHADSHSTSFGQLMKENLDKGDILVKSIQRVEKSVVANRQGVG